MGGFSMMHWVVVALVVLVLFGRGKIAETMGDFGKGIRSFKRGIAEEDTPHELAPIVDTKVADSARNATDPIGQS